MSGTENPMLTNLPEIVVGSRQQHKHTERKCKEKDDTVRLQIGDAFRDLHGDKHGENAAPRREQN